jgi:hypothetical protein
MRLGPRARHRDRSDASRTAARARCRPTLARCRREDGREHLAVLRRREGDHRHLLRHPQGRDPRHHRPNGAGKTSMLNVINGFYTPQQGTITFKGGRARKMRPHQAARQGIARTFQNVALFKGMSTLDNIMTGPQPAHEARPVLADALGRAHGRRSTRRSSTASRSRNHRLPGDPAYPQGAGRQAALRPAEARRARPRAGDGARCCCSTSRWPA